MTTLSSIKRLPKCLILATSNPLFILFTYKLGPWIVTCELAVRSCLTLSSFTSNVALDFADWGDLVKSFKNTGCLYTLRHSLLLHLQIHLLASIKNLWFEHSAYVFSFHRLFLFLHFFLFNLSILDVLFVSRYYVFLFVFIYLSTTSILHTFHHFFFQRVIPEHLKSEFNLPFSNSHFINVLHLLGLRDFVLCSILNDVVCHFVYQFWVALLHWVNWAQRNSRG